MLIFVRLSVLTPEILAGTSLFCVMGWDVELDWQLVYAWSINETCTSHGCYGYGIASVLALVVQIPSGWTSVLASSSASSVAVFTEVWDPTSPKSSP